MFDKTINDLIFQLKVNSTNNFIPTLDPKYCFDYDLTKVILYAIQNNHSMIINGWHGSGKTSHIEQIASLINWPCIKINMDNFLSRSELIGKDQIIIKDNQQITQFKEGLIPFATQNRAILILDEYDNCHNEINLILQQIIDTDYKQYSILENNKVINKHQNFRIFATTNNIKNDYIGKYNIGNNILDRWKIVYNYNYPNLDQEKKIIYKKYSYKITEQEQEYIEDMLNLAHLTRNAYEQEKIENFISLRSLINWLDNYFIFFDIKFAFKLSFMNKLNNDDYKIIKELFQRVFNDIII